MKVIPGFRQMNGIEVLQAGKALKTGLYVLRATGPTEITWGLQGETALSVQTITGSATQLLQALDGDGNPIANAWLMIRCSYDLVSAILVGIAEVQVLAIPDTAHELEHTKRALHEAQEALSEGVGGADGANVRRDTVAALTARVHELERELATELGTRASYATADFTGAAYPYVP
jgi:hypothetical protein